jgi:flagellar assembly protein FliH
MMISYSKVFKSSNLSLVDEVKVITQPPISFHSNEDERKSEAVHREVDIPEIRQVLYEAQVQAQAIIDKAEKNACLIEAAAQEQINQMWDETKKKLETMALEAKQEGFTEGFANGKQEAVSQIQQEYQGKLEQVQHLLHQAYEQKEVIISEAEPFLLELSFAIASQILKQELACYPGKFVELIKQNILRFKEKEFITVCVHPDDFDFIHSQRAHLVAVVNGETEIKIIPDHSVTPKGCIIRTAYGSVDASIDTQIEEIKKVILEAGRKFESVPVN